MTEKDTLLDIAVYCMMARRGIADSSDVVDRILERIKPFCDDGLKEFFSNNCGKSER